jgi:hypothetical protein
MPERERTEERVDCRRCRHFAVTYRMPRAYACRPFGFESAQIPSAEVLASSGETCRAFEPRASAAPAPEEARPREGAG